MNQKKAPPKRGFSIWRPRSELNDHPVVMYIAIPEQF